MNWEGPRPLVEVARVRATPAALLPDHIENEDGLSLWQAPLQVWRFDRQPDGREYLGVIGASLGRRGLMDFLAAIAPYKGRGLDDFSGVLDDWYLHDRALTSAPSEKLFRDHLESLRDDWIEFTRHRSLFVAVMEDRSEMTRLVPVLRWETPKDGARRWLYDSLTPDEDQVVRDAIGLVAPAGATVTLSPLAGFLSVLYFLPELTLGWPEWKPLAVEGKSNYMGPAQVPVLALLNKRASLDSVFIARLEALTEASQV
jgi:hypothetical protein